MLSNNVWKQAILISPWDVLLQVREGYASQAPIAEARSLYSAPQYGIALEQQPNTHEAGMNIMAMFRGGLTAAHRSNRIGLAAPRYDASGENTNNQRRGRRNRAGQSMREPSNNPTGRNRAGGRGRPCQATINELDGAGTSHVDYEAGDGAGMSHLGNLGSFPSCDYNYEGTFFNSRQFGSPSGMHYDTNELLYQTPPQFQLFESRFTNDIQCSPTRQEGEHHYNNTLIVLLSFGSVSEVTDVETMEVEQQELAPPNNPTTKVEPQELAPPISGRYKGLVCRQNPARIIRHPRCGT